MKLRFPFAACCAIASDLSRSPPDLLRNRFEQMYRKMLDGILIGEFVRGTKLELDEKNGAREAPAPAQAGDEFLQEEGRHTIACSNCGQKSASSLKYCGNCGARLDGAAASTEPMQVKGSCEQPCSEGPAGSKRVPAAVVTIGLVAVAAVAVVLYMTMFSPQARADRLYKEGSYVEALELYQSIGQTDKNDDKMSDCRYNMFVSYLMEKGPYETSDSSGNAWTVEGYANGDIKCSLSGAVAGNQYGGLESSWVITIHRGSTTADLNVSEKMKILGQSLSETGSGKIDLPSYTYGKDIVFDTYSNTGTTAGSSLIKSNSGCVSKMIQKGFSGAADWSKTGVTLADLGFESL